MAEIKNECNQIPDKNRRSKGPVVVIECFQEIPCNPCYEACNRGAIQTFSNINNLPRVDFNKCNGCGRCIPVCPGLAIFVVDETWKEDFAIVRVPYEFLPIPKKGEYVKGLSRDGSEVCDAKVIKVESAKRHDKTCVIWIEVPKDFSMDVRHIHVRRGSI